MKCLLPWIVLLFLSIGLWPDDGLAAVLSSPLDPWNGEYMGENEGAVYVRFYLDGFRKTRSFKDITNSVFMNLRNTKTGKLYVLSQAPTESTADVLQIWKIPSGQYSVEKLSINENTGITRAWTSAGQSAKAVVKNLHLSNMGMVRLSPFGKFGLKMSVLSAPNTYENTASHQSFVAVVDAYRGRLQKTLGGAQLQKAAKDNFSVSGEARTAFTMSRQISMIYQVNSTGTQGSRQLLSSTLSAQDGELRRCYMDQLDLTLGLRGTVTYNFKIAANNGSFQLLRYNGGTLTSPKAVECLTLALKKLQFPINKALVGQLIFQFNYDDNPGRAKFK
ncbi:MAG: hypothetical protein EOP10_03165 [Proteobacteria bacterium]|nr:MAG: hypothetical protein EOP10_03165 [Pseudomonadota bacterium]